MSRKRPPAHGAKPGNGRPSHTRQFNDTKPETRSHAPKGSHKDRSRERDPQRSQTITFRSTDGYFLFGRNSIVAALANPARECVTLIGTQKALDDIDIPARRTSLRVATVENADSIAANLPIGAPHQGLLMEVRPLPSKPLDSFAPKEGQKNIILMLDQVTDPQNVGACLRSAAALGARALITQDKNSPKESGTLARASAGGIEVLPWVQVTNLSQALESLKNMGYWHVGLDGNTDIGIKDIDAGENIVIVMGSEGSGLRPLVKKHCDYIVRIPMSGAVESLNVSNAAAIALYELS